jgi:hypothetical protein
MGYTGKGPNMTYLVICQNGRVLPSCLNQNDLLIVDGPMFVGEINNRGAIVHLSRGTIVDGRFYPMQGEASVTRP